MLHAAYHAYLQGMLKEHDALQDHGPDAEMAFMNDMSARLAKLARHAEAYKDFERTKAALKEMGGSIGLSMELEDPVPQNPERTPEGPENRYAPPAPMQYAPEDLAVMANPDTTAWTEQKTAAVMENPDVHPDSITPEGRVQKNGWLWREIKMLADRYPTQSLGQILPDLPGRTRSAVSQKLMVLGIRKSAQAPSGAPAAGRPAGGKTRKAQGKARANKKKAPAGKDVEDRLPTAMKSPRLPARLRIFRMASSVSAAQAAEAAGMKKCELYDMENGKTEPGPETLDKLAAVYGVSPDVLASRPMGEIMPFGQCRTGEERLRRARIRCGLSVEMLAGRTGDNPAFIAGCEQKLPNANTIARLAAALGLPASMILNGTIPDDFDESKSAAGPAGIPDTDLPTGMKVHNARVRAGMSSAELAGLTGCSSSHIYNIENQRVCPSDELLQKLARALGVPTHELQGLNIYQPKAMYQSRKTAGPQDKPKTEKPPAAGTTAVPAASPAGRQTQESPQESIQQKIIDARTAMNLSQNALASRAQCPLAAVKELESIGLTGSNKFMLRKVAHVLNLELPVPA